MALHSPIPSFRPASAPVRRSGGPQPVAIVTGANHGIGAATARALASAGARVLVSGLPLEEHRDPAIPDAYYDSREQSPEAVAAAIKEMGGDAIGVVQDLADIASPALLFDTAESAFGEPVRILIHNATGWVADSFRGSGADRLGRGLRQCRSPRSINSSPSTPGPVGC